MVSAHAGIMGKVRNSEEQENSVEILEVPESKSE